MVPGAVIKTEADVDQAVKEIGLPMIAKPDNGVGAAATFKLETEDDINHFKQEWDHSTVYFFEKFVTSSEICTFDGLVDKDGKIVFSTTFDYAYTPLDLMIYKMDNSYYVLKDMDPKLRKYGEAIVKEFGMKERFFHIEFFREGDDYIAIEYNNRPAGGFTIDVYNFAHSLDLYRGYAAIVAGEEFPASEFEPQFCLATSRRANAHYVYSEEDLLAKYSHQFKVKKNHACSLCGTSRGLPVYADNSESTRNGANDCRFRTTSRIRTFGLRKITPLILLFFYKNKNRFLIYSFRNILLKDIKN